MTILIRSPDTHNIRTLYTTDHSVIAKKHNLECQTNFLNSEGCSHKKKYPLSKEMKHRKQPIVTIGIYISVELKVKLQAYIKT